MKRLLVFILLLLATEARMQAQFGNVVSNVTAFVTVTNLGTNGDTFAINGNVRTLTNFVSTVNNQIQTPTNAPVNQTNQMMTNLLLAFATYPEVNPPVNMITYASNEIEFIGVPGQALVISTNMAAGGTNWVKWTYFTNFFTNSAVVRIPTNAIGSLERSNVESGLIAYLSDNPGGGSALFVNHSSPFWVQFLGTNFGAGLTNFILTLSTNSTNFTLTLGTNSTNFTLTKIFNSSNYVSNVFVIFSNMFTGVQPGCAALSNFCAAFPGGVFPALSYQDTGNVTGNTANIYLTNTTGLERVLITDGGSSQGSYGPSSFFDSGYNLWLYDDASGTVTIRDGSGSSVNRAEFDQIGQNNGNTSLCSGTHNNGFVLSGLSDDIQTYKPISQNSASWPFTSSGTATNFSVTVQDTGTGETALNQFSVPANTFTNVGDTMIRTVGVTMTGSGSYDVKVYAFGDTIFDTGVVTVTSSATLSITAECTASTVGSGGVLKYNCSAIGSSGLSTTIFSQVGSQTGVNFTSTGACKIGLAGAGTGDGKILIDNVRFAPSSAWTLIP